jgi:hypothetical protein
MRLAEVPHRLQHERKIKMFPIKLLETEYVNPDAVQYVQLIPKGQGASDAAVFRLFYRNTEFLPLEYRGAEAEEAFENWKTAYAREVSTSCCDRGTNA